MLGFDPLDKLLKTTDIADILNTHARLSNSIVDDISGGRSVTSEKCLPKSGR